jgi:hypothetical protein
MTTTTPTASNEPAVPAASVSKAALWGGRIMSALPVLALLLSAVTKFAKPPPVVEGFNHLGIPITMAAGLGIVEIACTILYIIPRTALLGAILVTGYLGGAICATLRVGDAYILTIILGVLVWGGLYLRDPRLRALIPLRCKY